jgi:hypothetical protein
MSHNRPIDERKKGCGVLRLEAMKLIRFVTLWRSGWKPLKVVLKFTF